MKKSENPYEKKEVVTNTQYINIYEYREVDLNTIMDKLEQEIKKRKNKSSQQKDSKVQSVTLGNITIHANLYVKRLETDAEYNKRIAMHEKQEEAKRKKEEQKLKKEFKKLQELKEKFGDCLNEEQAIRELRTKELKAKMFNTK